LDHFYPLDFSLDKKPLLQLSLRHPKKKRLEAYGPQPLDRWPYKGTLDVKGVAEDDCTLGGTLLAPFPALADSRQTMSVVPSLEERLGKVEKAAAALPRDARTTEALTLRTLAKLLRQLADGKTLETDYPAARLLREAEGVAAALDKGKRYYGADKVGQF